MANTYDRREALGLGFAGALALGVRSEPARAAPNRAKFRNGLCATSFAEPLIARNVAYRSGRATASSMIELQKLMMAHGSNEVFVRLGSSRTSGRRSSEPHMVAAKRRAQLAKSVNLPLNPEFLLCAHYGDMGGQPEPDFSGYPEIKLSKPWHELGVEEMCDAMRLYGAIVARELLDTGVTVNVWDIGNEVEFGVAGVAMRPTTPNIGGPGWTYRAPDAVDPEIGRMTLGRFFMMKTADKVAWGEAHLWNHTGRILAAVADGIREVEPKARFATHASAIASLMPEVFVGFHQAVEAAGFRAEEMGVSYYPTNTKLIPHRLETFKRTARLTMERLKRPIYIAEYSYAAGPVTYGGNDWANPVDGYPCTPQGQADFLRDLVQWGAGEQLISGVRPWAPDYVGAGWQGMALFDAPVDGVALARPGLAAIQQGLKLAGRRRA